ncbi:hypothetical protein ACLRDC_18360 [Gluconacetobacter sacchari]|uniref:Secreted protein n=2 Tax=Gluconacetobacter sacchari TaxID=92759 RepID=A0A7W4IG49_9PROT|nr:hypothetical protein [Gluconacetobacter sacchari]MBB2162258.1 hypothetical protein [Gluconacetobacter sacchari]GBQ22509.1 hypothetical protein AA12717_1210 [Gluconacetobacter sacchari DSM 12717]
MTITHSGRRAVLFLSGLLAATPAIAQDDGAAGSPALELQRIVAALQVNPNAASQACVDALTELHKTQATLDAEQTRTNDPDVDVARDVLETDFETAIHDCQPDAAALCAKGGTDPKLAKACLMVDQAAPPPK